ncbi:hypothetical protein [Paludisphaera soli]|uniref:hypothetical protein n=1 Tax=Paludisphaera soli TaxID=2712865 RepID=UPI0013EA356A|nr:hypothetical protein [Paludisphaera soli]
MSFLTKLRPSRRSRTIAPRRARIGVEALDERVLLSVSANLDPWGKLAIVGGAGNDDVVVYPSGDAVYVMDRSADATVYSRMYRNVASIDFRGGAGDDYLLNVTAIPTSFTGGAGADRYVSGTGTNVVTDLESVDVFQNRGSALAVNDRTTGVLTIKGSPWNDEAGVSASGPNTYRVDLNEVYVDGLAGFRRIEFDGGAGNDYFGNATSLPSRLNGGPGDDHLAGGTGDDLFLGSDGRDVYDTISWRGGSDLLDRNGFRGTLTGPGQTIGLVSGALTPEELSAKGELTVSRSGDYVTLNGPSGAGFRLRGSWIAFSAGGQNFYYSFSPVYLETAAGELPMSPGMVYIGARASGIADVGTFLTAYWPGLGLDTVTPTSPLHAVADATGLGIQLNPTGAELTVGLGSTLKANGIEGPLNDAVPYFSFRVSTSAGIKLGGTTVKTPGSSIGVQGAFDPSDPFLFVRVDPEIGKNPLEEFALGWSTRGRIPFTPRTPIATASQAVYGNVYAMAGVKLGNYPIKINGETVLDLDANDDGRMLGLSGADLARVIRGELDLGTIVGALTDVRIGLNGAASLSLAPKNSSGAEVVKLSLDLSYASAIISPSVIAFRATGADFFKGTPLEGAVKLSSYDVQGLYSLSTRSWFFDATSSTAGVNGHSFGQVTLSGDSTRGTITASARFSPPLGFTTVTMNGYLDYTNGNFSLYASASASLDAKVTRLNATIELLIQQTAGNFRFYAGLRASFSQNLGVGSMKGQIYAMIDFQAGKDGVSLSGSGSASGSAQIDGLGSVGFSSSFMIDTSGFQIRLADGLPTLSVNW